MRSNINGTQNLKMDCESDPLNGRPIAGSVEWNTHLLKYNLEDRQSMIAVINIKTIFYF